MKAYNKHLPLLIVITLLIAVISIGCMKKPDTTGFEYEIIYVEGMPCMWGRVASDPRRAGLSCDWSQWEGNNH